MRQHRPEFRHLQHLHQGKSDAHDAPASQPHESARLADEGIRISQQIDLRRHGFLQSGRNVFDMRGKAFLFGQIDENAVHFSLVPPRQKRPENGDSRYQPKCGQKQPHEQVGTDVPGHRSEQKDGQGKAANRQCDRENVGEDDRGHPRRAQGNNGPVS